MRSASEGAGLWETVSDSDPAPKPGRKKCLPASTPEIQTFQDYNYPARPAHGPASPWSHRSRPGGSGGEGAVGGWQKGGASGLLLVREREGGAGRGCSPGVGQGSHGVKDPQVTRDPLAPSVDPGGGAQAARGFSGRGPEKQWGLRRSFPLSRPPLPHPDSARGARSSQVL